MSNCHYTAKTTAKRNVQRTAHSIIQKGASTQRHTGESEIRTKARKPTYFGVVRAFSHLKQIYRKLDLLQSRVDLSAPIYARLLNGRFELSEETFCKMLLDYRGECDLKTNEIEKNQEVILTRGKKRF